MNFKEAGAQFLNRLLEHIPEAERGALATTLSANAPLLEALGKDAAAVAGVESERARLNVWFTQNKDALTRAKPLLEAQAAGKLRLLDDTDDGDAEDPLNLGGGRRRAPQPAGLSEADVQSRIATAVSEATRQTQTEGLQLINSLTKLAMTHYKEFGSEVLDTDALTEFAIKNNLRLDIAYGEFVKPLRDTRDKAAREADLAAAVERGKKEGREEAFNRQVPVPAGSASSTLSGLTLTPEKKIDTSAAGLRADYAAATAGTL